MFIVQATGAYPRVDGETKILAALFTNIKQGQTLQLSDNRLKCDITLFFVAKALDE